jgi:hypothetical protein
MLSLVFIIPIAAALALAALRRRSQDGYRARIAPFTSRPLMTSNEIEFFSRLRRALPECVIFSQVSMSALIDVTLPASDPDYLRARDAFNRKRLDYVVCTRGGERVIAVVELDDRSHDPKRGEDAKRDGILATAGIRTVRFPSSPRPNERQIRDQVLGRHTA